MYQILQTMEMVKWHVSTCIHPREQHQWKTSGIFKIQNNTKFEEWSFKHLNVFADIYSWMARPSVISKAFWEETDKNVATSVISSHPVIVGYKKRTKPSIWQHWVNAHLETPKLDASPYGIKSPDSKDSKRRNSKNVSTWMCFENLFFFYLFNLL